MTLPTPPRPRWAGPVLALACLALAGCSAQPPAKSQQAGAEAQTDLAPRQGGTLVVVQERPTTLDPLPSTDVYSSTIANQIFTGLLRFGANLDPTPALAQTWTISPDGLTYVFKVRRDARFHNGRALTAADVAYSLSRAFEPGGENIASHYLAAIAGAEEYKTGRAKSVSGIRVRGDDELFIRLKRPDPSFLWALCLPQAAVVPREEVARAGADAFSRRPVGCGPFRFVSWTEHHVVLVCNRDYFGERPNVDTLVFLTPAVLTADFGSRDLLAGRAQIAEVREAYYDTVAHSPQFRVTRRRELTLGFLGLNCRIPPLDNPKVREAVACAIDRQALVRADSLGAVLANGVIPPGVQSYSPAPKALPFDPERSRRALEAAGYAGGGGLPPLDYWVPVRSGLRRVTDSLLVTNLEAVGFKVRVHEVEWRALNRRIDARTAALFNLSWIADIPDPDSFLGSLFESGSTSNMFEYHDAYVDTTLRKARESRDPMQRGHYFQLVERDVIADVAVVPLNHSATLYGTSARVHGFDLTPLGISVFDFSHVWLDEPQPAL